MRNQQDCAGDLALVALDPQDREHARPDDAAGESRPGADYDSRSHLFTPSRPPGLFDSRSIHVQFCRVQMKQR